MTGIDATAFRVLKGMVWLENPPTMQSAAHCTQKNGAYSNVKATTFRATKALLHQSLGSTKLSKIKNAKN